MYVMNEIGLVFTIYVGTDTCFVILIFQIKRRLLKKKKRK
jgi:hypothetical protein